MNIFLHEAREELKRVDHLISVSLKYTRTVDVFKSIIERIINAFDAIINGLLEKGKEEKRIESIPSAPRLKCEECMKLFDKDEQMQGFLNFYIFMRSINRAEFDRRNEFRRHVTMIAYLDNDEIVEIKLEDISEYYAKSRALVDYAKIILEGEEE